MKNNWWAVEFDVPWSEPQPWHVHLAIAHNLLPTINAFEARFKDGLWSFHRATAVIEATQGIVLKFSFKFYSPRDVACAVYQEIRSTTVLKRLVDEKFMNVSVSPDPSEGNMEDQDIEAICRCEKWDPKIKKTWPYYINGISKMWVRLIDEISRSISKGETSDDLDHYREVDNEISRMLRENGRHALLHHMNAVFGYKEIDLTGSRSLKAHILNDEQGTRGQVLGVF